MSVKAALQRTQRDHFADAKPYPKTMFADRQVLAVEVKRLRAIVAKMSHRRCWDCGHIGYYVNSTLPYCRCEECGSTDTRLIRKTADAEKGD